MGDDIEERLARMLPCELPAAVAERALAGGAAAWRRSRVLRLRPLTAAAAALIMLDVGVGAWDSQRTAAALPSADSAVARSASSQSLCALVAYLHESAEAGSNDIR